MPSGTSSDVPNVEPMAPGQQKPPGRCQTMASRPHDPATSLDVRQRVRRPGHVVWAHRHGPSPGNTSPDVFLALWHVPRMGHVAVSTGRTGHAKRHVHALWHISGHAGPAADDLQAVRNHQDGAFRVPAIACASCTHYDVSGHPDTPFGPSTVVHHPGTHSNMRSTSPDMLGRRPNAVSHYRDRAVHFLCQKTCPSHRTRLHNVMDFASTQPSTPRPFHTTGSSLSPSPPPGTHFLHPMTPRAYPDHPICLWAPG